MKKIITILPIVLIAASCKKDIKFSAYDNLAGEWEYVDTRGYVGVSQPPPPGNGRIIAFKFDRTFERRSHDTVLYSGSFFVEERKDCYGDEKHFFITTTDSLFTNGFRFNITSDSLFIIHSNCVADAGIFVYRKL